MKLDMSAYLIVIVYNALIFSGISNERASLAPHQKLYNDPGLPTQQIGLEGQANRIITCE